MLVNKLPYLFNVLKDIFVVSFNESNNSVIQLIVQDFYNCSELSYPTFGHFLNHEDFVVNILLLIEKNPINIINNFLIVLFRYLILANN